MKTSEQNRANKIIKEKEKIITSEKDKKIFFDCLVNAPEPNADLLSAKKEYDKLVSQ